MGKKYNPAKKHAGGHLKKEASSYLGDGLPMCVRIERAKKYVKGKPECRKCGGTVVTDPFRARDSYCFSCGAQYKWEPKRGLVGRWE